MKYTVDIVINQNIDKVIRLFNDSDKMVSCMEGLHKIEHMSGVPGQPGARAHLLFKMGNREFDIVETILKRDLPNEFAGSYETDSVMNIVVNKFEALDGERTKYTTEHEFRFKSILMKILGFIMPSMFKIQSIKFLENFKAYVESHSFDEEE